VPARADAEADGPGGGGLRSAAFAMNVLQVLDSITNGTMMKHTVLMTGASGGMLGAAYFRQLYWEKQQGHIASVRENKYVDDIAKDLLNPLFASFVSRDLIGPVKKFESVGWDFTELVRLRYGPTLTRWTRTSRDFCRYRVEYGW
jgi:hypothetical protein